ncbi:MAG: TraR/DksA C4-type zinc finger protein [Minicystis sp.]
MSDETSPRKGGAVVKQAETVEAPRIPKRPVVSAVAEGDDESPELTDEQREELKQKLEELRVQLIASIEERRGEERHITHDVGDEMDEASLEGTAAMTSKLLERDVQQLGRIDRALHKMREGTYGLCEGTGDPIGFARLRLQPWARYSVEYQESVERHAKSRGM